MFVGHYSVAFAGKAANRKIPLWLLFLAVQFLDLLWSAFVLLGIEKVRIVPGLMAASALDLYFMPYTHSLVGALAWSLAAGLLFYFAFRQASAGILVGSAVFSHWILDLIVHRPDLALYIDPHGSSYKLGFGLWNYFWPELALEVLLLLAGFLWYMQGVKVPAAKRACWILLAVLIAMQCVDKFGPPPAGPVPAAISALAAYSVLAALAAWADKSRPVA